jgi:hypothetical protein
MCLRFSKTDGIAFNHKWANKKLRLPAKGSQGKSQAKFYPRPEWHAYSQNLEEHEDAM